LLRLETEELPDTVIFVDDVVAGTEVGERRERPAEAGVGARRPLAENLAVGQKHETELPPDEAATRPRGGEAQNAALRERAGGIRGLRVDPAQERLLPKRLPAMRKRDYDTMTGANEAVELGLRLGEPARCDRRPLRLERERLAARERIELG